MDVNYEFQPAFTLMTANLGPGESIKVEPGAMVAQSSGLSVSTGKASKGGLIGGLLKAAVGGESFFVNTYSAGPSGGWISLAPSAPGDIFTFDLTPGQSLFMQGGAFMACSPNVEYDTKFQGAKSLLSREGAFFLRASSEGGAGQVFYTSYGAIKEIEVTPDAPVVVDNGHLVAFTEGVSYGVAASGGLKTTMFGGEGLVLELTGSGKIWIQSRNMAALADKLTPFLPQRSN
jgi:uncharacterized protein (TIGR00266 family)|tara:strand:- start:972 stop:1667 length:696 start_codon:yes stop_codon:yes gene_type:complete